MNNWLQNLDLIGDSITNDNAIYYELLLYLWLFRSEKILSAVFYYFSLPFIYLLAILPFPLLYLFSDLVYFLLYHVLRYRRKVVRKIW